MAGAVASCGNGAGDLVSVSAPGLHVVSGAGVTDTVGTILSQPLVVRVVGASRRPIADAIVYFESGTIRDSLFPEYEFPTMGVVPMGSIGVTAQVVAITDADGFASARVATNSRAGSGSIVVRVPETGWADTARYTIAVGNLARVRILPHDTSVYVGGNITPRVEALDRFSNRRTELPTLTVSGSGMSLSGSVISGTGIGRAVATVRYGSLSDSMLVSIVPRGTIAAFASPSNSDQERAIYTFDLDGTHLRRIVTPARFSGPDMAVVWSQDGRSVFYHDAIPTAGNRLWVVDATTTAATQLIAGQHLGDERFPTRSADGQWVYFNGPDAGISMAWRVHTDGTGLELISVGGAFLSYPHPSPDGKQLVYAESREIGVMNLSTKTMTRLGVSGDVARWSPSGAFIAVRGNSGLTIVRPDGTPVRVLAPQTSFALFFDWSPDEKYLVTSVAGTLTLVDASTGALLPVKLSSVNAGIVYPSWRPSVAP